MPSAQELLVEEASDPTTEPRRLAKLADDPYGVYGYVASFARGNPNLPEEVLLRFLRAGDRAAWGNPSAAFVLLTHMGDLELYRGACRAVAFEAQELPRWMRDDTARVLEMAKPLVEQGWGSARLQDMLFFPAACAEVHRQQGSRLRNDDLAMHVTLVDMAIAAARALQRKGGSLLHGEPDELLQAAQSWVQKPCSERAAVVDRLRKEGDERMWANGESPTLLVLVGWRTTMDALGALVLHTDHTTRAFSFGNIATSNWRDIEEVQTGLDLDEEDGSEQGSYALAKELRQLYPEPPWP